MPLGCSCIPQRMLAPGEHWFFLIFYNCMACLSKWAMVQTKGKYVLVDGIIHQSISCNKILFFSGMLWTLKSDRSQFKSGCTLLERLWRNFLINKALCVCFSICKISSSVNPWKILWGFRCKQEVKHFKRHPGTWKVWTIHHHECQMPANTPHSPIATCYLDAGYLCIFCSSRKLWFWNSVTQHWKFQVTFFHISDILHTVKDINIHPFKCTI